MPGGETAIYVKAQARPFGLTVLDRWLYNPKTGETKLVRSDSSGPEGVTDVLKGIPLPIIP